MDSNQENVSQTAEMIDSGRMSEGEKDVQAPSHQPETQPPSHLDSSSEEQKAEEKEDRESERKEAEGKEVAQEGKVHDEPIFVPSSPQPQVEGNNLETSNNAERGDQDRGDAKIDAGSESLPSDALPTQSKEALPSATVMTTVSAPGQNTVAPSSVTAHPSSAAASAAPPASTAAPHTNGSSSAPRDGPEEYRASLRARIEREGRDGDAWLALIAEASSRADLEGIRKIYEDLFVVFPNAVSPALRSPLPHT